MENKNTLNTIQSPKRSMGFNHCNTRTRVVTATDFRGVQNQNLCATPTTIIRQEQIGL